MLGAGSRHQNEDLACNSCHKVHTNKDKVFSKVEQADVCFTCHKAQRTQIERAHRYMERALGAAPTMFAYPNGNWTAASADAARKLGYEASLLFDHRLVSSKASTDRVSRLRINTDASEKRGLGILSGAHSAAFHLTTIGERADASGS